MRTIKLLLGIFVLLLCNSLIFNQSSTLPKSINVNMANNADFGEYLTDGNAITLYMFELDTKNVSNCTGNCLNVWPPYLIDKNAKPMAGTGINQNMIGTITLPNSTVQVTYNGWPLYYYRGEIDKPNIVKCQAIRESGGFWFIIKANGNVNFTTLSKPNNTGKRTLEVGTSNTFGKHITDKDNVVLYAFEKDSFLKSNCYNDCATDWPPYIISSSEIPSFGSEIDGSLIFYTLRTDNTRQVTYNGWPLYYYKGEKTSGTTKCQNVNMNGGYWWLMKLNGEVNRSAQTQNSSSSSNYLTSVLYVLLTVTLISSLLFL